MIFEPVVQILILAFHQFFSHLLLNRLDLLPQGEVIVELGFNLSFAWELGEQKVQEVYQPIEPIAKLNDPIRAEVLDIILSLSPEDLLHGQFFFPHLAHLILGIFIGRLHIVPFSWASFHMLAFLPWSHTNLHLIVTFNGFYAV